MEAEEKVNMEMASYFAQKRALAEEETLTQRAERQEQLKLLKLQRLEMLLKHDLLSTQQKAEVSKQMLAIALDNDHDNDDGEES